MWMELSCTIPDRQSTHGATNFLFRGLVRVRTPPHDSVKVRIMN